MQTKENKNGKGGIVYILINDAMLGYIKIGKTTKSVDQRILELSRSSAVPFPFECYYAVRVADVDKVEKSIHDAFGDHRINPKREFFKIAPERIVAILKLLSIEDVTPSRDIGVESKEDAIAIEKARKIRSAFNFKIVNIPAGAELKFIRDERITCRVAKDEKHVEFQGEITSLSSLAQKILGTKWKVQGPAYWTYGGEILDELRMRLEEEDSEPTPDEIDSAGDRWIQLQIDQERGK